MSSPKTLGLRWEGGAGGGDNMDFIENLAGRSCANLSDTHWKSQGVPRRDFRGSSGNGVNRVGV